MVPRYHTIDDLLIAKGKTYLSELIREVCSHYLTQMIKISIFIVGHTDIKFLLLGCDPKYMI